jgi:hypothetical protein
VALQRFSSEIAQLRRLRIDRKEIPSSSRRRRACGNAGSTDPTANESTNQPLQQLPRCYDPLLIGWCPKEIGERRKAGYMVTRMRQDVIRSIFGGLGLLVIPLVFSLCGCSSSALSRGNAKEVIEQSDAYKPKKIGWALTKGQADELVRRGYLKWKPDIRYTFESTLSITPSGRNYFDDANGIVLVSNGVVNVTREPVVISSIPMNRAVEVTGIADGGDQTKIVSYRWNWNLSNQPNEIRDVMSQNNPDHVGEAKLRLFDDGWRVAEIR